MKTTSMAHTIKQRSRTVDTALEDIFSRIIAFPSVSTDMRANHEALAYIADYVRERGMYGQMFEASPGRMHEAFLASTRKDNFLAPTVLLAAHVDVVSADPSMFVLRKENGRYIGRGVLDMKFAIAAYLRVIDELRAELTEYDFGLLITSEEELGGISGVRELLKIGLNPKVVILPDGGENWQLETAANGYVVMSLEARGKTGHSSRPWLADNAAARLTDCLHAIKQHFKDHGPETDTLNIATIKTSSMQPNQIPDSASADISIRLRHPGKLAYWLKLFSDICQEQRVVFREVSSYDAIKNDVTNPYVHQFALIVEDIVGVKNVGFHSFAGSDAHFIAEKHIPYINTYPTGGGHHSDHEWLAEESLVQFKEVVLRYLQETAKGEAVPRER